MEILYEKIKEVAGSVAPIVGIILLLHMTWSPLAADTLIRCGIGTVLVVIGLAIFHVGVDIGITPVGTHLGQVVTKYGKVFIVVLSGLVLGFAISMAEPDLRIYGQQVEELTNGLMTEWMLVLAVSIGIAFFLAMGLWRIVRSVPLKYVFWFYYGMIALLCLFVPSEFIALSFDASGTTTGAMTVPFFLALAAGVSRFKSANSIAEEEDSFGLVGIASAGAIAGVLIMAIWSNQPSFSATVHVAEKAAVGPMWETFWSLIPHTMLEVMAAVLPVIVLFYGAHLWAERVNRYDLHRINMGLIYTYLGLVIFMLGVNFGFNRAGYEVGLRLGALNDGGLLCLVGLVIGLAVILAEPAVIPLVHQIEEITSGYVRQKMILISLSLAVGGAVCFSMLRIVLPGLELWHLLLPGYALALILSLVVPNLFVGMAFDSGGVASGPMAATFVLSFADGAARAFPGADVFLDGFGVVALIALMPIVALQILGLIFKIKSGRKSS